MTDEITQTDQSAPSEGSWFALITTAIAAFVLVTSEFLPIGLINEIAKELEISIGTAGLMITLPGIMAAISAAFLPIFSKGLDRRYLLIILTMTMIIANAITAISTNFTILLLSRFILGFAIGGFWGTAIALSGKLAPAHLHISTATATIMSGVTLAAILGVPIGTWLSNFYGWRNAFAITAVLGVFALIFEVLSLPSLKPQSSLKFKELPSLFRVPKARQGMCIIFLMGFAHFAAYSYMTPFFKNVAMFDTAQISLLLLIYGIAGFLGNAFAGYSGNINVRYTFAFLAACYVIVFFGFPSFATEIYAAFILTGLWGFAFGAFPTTANVWMFVHAPDAVEKGLPLFVATFQIMIATGALFGGYIIDHFNANILLYSVISFIFLALLSIFTISRGLNNPKIETINLCCDNSGSS